MATYAGAFPYPFPSGVSVHDPKTCPICKGEPETYGGYGRKFNGTLEVGMKVARYEGDRILTVSTVNFTNTQAILSGVEESIDSKWVVMRRADGYWGADNDSGYLIVLEQGEKKKKMSTVISELLKSKKQKLYEKYILNSEGKFMLSGEVMQEFLLGLFEKNGLEEFVTAYDKKLEEEAKARK